MDLLSKIHGVTFVNEARKKKDDSTDVAEPKKKKVKQPVVDRSYIMYEVRFDARKMTADEINNAINNFENALEESGVLTFFGQAPGKVPQTLTLNVITTGDIKPMIPEKFTIDSQKQINKKKVDEQLGKRVVAMGRIIKSVIDRIYKAEKAPDEKNAVVLLASVPYDVIALKNYREDSAKEVQKQIDDILNRYNALVEKYNITQEKLDDAAIIGYARDVVDFEKGKFEKKADIEKKYMELQERAAKLEQQLKKSESKMKDLGEVNKLRDESVKGLLVKDAIDNDPKLQQKIQDIGSGKISPDQAIEEINKEDAEAEKESQGAQGAQGAQAQAQPQAVGIEKAEGAQGAQGVTVTAGLGYSHDFNPNVICLFGKRTHIILPVKTTKGDFGMVNAEKNEHLLSKMVHAIDNLTNYTPEREAAATIAAYDHFRQGVGLLVQWGTKVTLGTVVGLVMGATLGLVTGDFKGKFKKGQRGMERIGEYFRNLMTQRAYEINPAVEPLDKWVTTKMNLKDETEVEDIPSRKSYKQSYEIGPLDTQAKQKRGPVRSMKKESFNYDDDPHNLEHINEEIGMPATAGDMPTTTGAGNYIQTPPGGSSDQNKHPGSPIGAGTGAGDPHAPTKDKDGSMDKFQMPNRKKKGLKHRGFNEAYIPAFDDFCNILKGK